MERRLLEKPKVSIIHQIWLVNYAVLSIFRLEITHTDRSVPPFSEANWNVYPRRCIDFCSFSFHFIPIPLKYASSTSSYEVAVVIATPMSASLFLLETLWKDSVSPLANKGASIAKLGSKFFSKSSRQAALGLCMHSGRSWIDYCYFSILLRVCGGKSEVIVHYEVSSQSDRLMEELYTHDMIR